MYVEMAVRKACFGTEITTNSKVMGSMGIIITATKAESRHITEGLRTNTGYMVVKNGKNFTRTLLTKVKGMTR